MNECSLKAPPHLSLTFWVTLELDETLDPLLCGEKLQRVIKLSQHTSHEVYHYLPPLLHSIPLSPTSNHSYTHLLVKRTKKENLVTEAPAVPCSTRVHFLPQALHTENIFASSLFSRKNAAMRRIRKTRSHSFGFFLFCAMSHKTLSVLSLSMFPNRL